MKTRKPITTILLLFLGIGATLPAPAAEPSNKPYEELLVSMTDRDISQRWLPEERRARIRAAMHWAIQEGVRQAPTVELSDRNLEKFMIPADNKENALQVPDYPSSARELVDTFVAEHRIDNAFVYAPQLLDLFPQWHRIGQSTESLVMKGTDRQNQLQELMTSDEYRLVERNRRTVDEEREEE